MKRLKKDYKLKREKVKRLKKEYKLKREKVILKKITNFPMKKKYN